jgi:hypothetical protein
MEKTLEFKFSHPLNRKDFFYPACELTRLICAVPTHKMKAFSHRQIETAKALGWKIKVDGKEI